jgi:hypothetical protein
MSLVTQLKLPGIAVSWLDKSFRAELIKNSLLVPPSGLHPVTAVDRKGAQFRRQRDHLPCGGRFVGARLNCHRIDQSRHHVRQRPKRRTFDLRNGSKMVAIRLDSRKNISQISASAMLRLVL